IYAISVLVVMTMFSMTSYGQQDCAETSISPPYFTVDTIIGEPTELVYKWTSGFSPLTHSWSITGDAQISSPGDNPVTVTTTGTGYYTLTMNSTFETCSLEEGIYIRENSPFVEKCPLNVMLILDESNSIVEFDFLDGVRESLDSFLVGFK